MTNRLIIMLTKTSFLCLVNMVEDCTGIPHQSPRPQEPTWVTVTRSLSGRWNSRLTFLPPPSPSFPHILSICYFAKSFKTLVTASRHIISQLKRLHMRRPEVPKRKGEGEKSYKKITIYCIPCYFGICVKSKMFHV